MVVWLSDYQMELIKVFGIMYKKYKYQGWKGGFVAHYFGHLEEGEWVEIGYLKYLWLKFNGYTVRKVKEKELKNGDNILITKLPFGFVI